MLRYCVEDYLHDIFDKEQSGFRFCRTGTTTLLSSCFGVQLCYLINCLDSFDCHNIADGIRDQQVESGLYIDCGYSEQQLKGRQSEEYLSWQFTYFSLIALDMLGIRPKYELEFLRKFGDHGYLKNWLERQDYDDFWYSSNLIMFLWYFLTYEKEKLSTSEYDTAIDLVFSFLNDSQDKMTGFWGNRVRSNLENGLYGAAHVYLFYNYYDRTFRFIDEIIASTIKLQRDNGLYGTREGGACEDYDGVEVLVRVFGKNCKYNDMLKDSLLSTYKKIVHTQHPQGGFSYKTISYYPPLLLKRLLGGVMGWNYYSFSGWEKMRSNFYEPDIWATYFRCLTIAHIEKALALPLSYDYSSYSLPAWGYLGNQQMEPAKTTRSA